MGETAHLNEFKAARPTCLGCRGKDAVFCRLTTDTSIDAVKKVVKNVMLIDALVHRHLDQSILGALCGHVLPP